MGEGVFSGFRLGISGIWFYVDLGLRFRAEILAKDFGNMVSGFFGLIFGLGFGQMVP